MRKRIENRHVTEIPMDITLSYGCDPVETTTRDLSASGVYVSSPIIFNEGELVECSFILPGALERFSFFAEVVRLDRHESDGREVGGLGLRFLDITSVDEHTLRKLLRGVEVADSPTERAWFN